MRQRSLDLGGRRSMGRAMAVPKVHPAVVGVGAGVAGAGVIGLITYYGARLAGRLAGPLALANGVLVGGTLGYLAASYYAEKKS